MNIGPHRYFLPNQTHDILIQNQLLILVRSDKFWFHRPTVCLHGSDLFLVYLLNDLANFRGDFVVYFHFCQIQKCRALIRWNVFNINFHKWQQALVPNYSKFKLLIFEAEEMIDQRVNGLIGQGILLLDKRLQEDTDGYVVVVHGGNEIHGRASMVHIEWTLFQETTEDICLLHSTISWFTQRKDDTFDECAWFEHSFREGLVKMDVQLFVIRYIITAAWQENIAVEQGCTRRCGWCETFCNQVHCSSSPMHWF